MARTVLLTLIASIAFAGTQVGFADKDDKPEYTTKQVMKAVFKGPLLKKVAGGSASDADKEMLVKYLKAMAHNEPKKGAADSWEEKTTALVTAAEKVAKGEDAIGDLKTAANCKACHSKHK